MTDFPGVQQLNTWVESQLAISQNFGWLFLLLFLGGLAASLLPCVYPLYPITVGILRNRAGGGVVPTLTYYAGLCITYSLLGALATATGGAFNAVLRLGATNLLIGGMFVVLALSTTGLLHFPTFGHRSFGDFGGILGTLLMGAAAGLLSSACVGPVVVSVLIDLAARTQDGFQLVTVLTGMAQMLVFGMGLGVPFLAIGLFGMKLPKSGRWMRFIQVALGCIILYFAYTYFEKALLIYGFDSENVTSIIGLGTLIGLMIYMFQNTEQEQVTRVKRALVGLVLLTALVALNQSIAERVHPVSSSPWANPQSTGNSLIEKEGNLEWHLDPDAAYRIAKLTSRNVFIDFYGDWCTNCKAFSALTQTDEALNAALQNAVLLKIYDTNPVFDKFRQDERFPELKVGLPFFLITNPDGDMIYKTNDYLKTDEMMLFLE
jgi:thiol:disulfide interchange protein DsbD